MVQGGLHQGWRFVWVLQASLWPSPPQGLYAITHQSLCTRPVPAEVHHGLGTECGVAALAAPRTRERGGGTNGDLGPCPAADTCSGDGESELVQEGEAPGAFAGLRRWVNP